MRRTGLLATLILLTTAAPAHAITIQTTDSSEPWQTWANQSQAPTWNGTLPLTAAEGYSGCGVYDGAAGCTSYAPQVDQTTGQILHGPPLSISTTIALGDETDYEHGYLMHELGQVFWIEYMTPADEDQFMSIVGIPGDHTDWDKLYTTIRYGVTISYPPYEWFAEGWRFCATFGINQPSTANTFSSFGYPGLDPSFAAQQRQVCQLIDRVGMENGVPIPTQQTYMPARLTGRVVRARISLRRNSRLARRDAGWRLSRFRTAP